MTGYTEIMTDPSYRGQIMVFAAPTVGNYGWKRDHMESDAVQVSGVVTRSAYSAAGYLDSALKESGIPGIDRVDTRSLVLKIREKGTVRGVISSRMEIPWDFPDPMKLDLVSEVVSNEVSRISSGRKITALVVDAGAKKSLLKRMSEIADLIVVPHGIDPAGYLGEADFIFVSNGPGDPSHTSLEPTVKFIGKQIGKKPVTGVCLGQQVIALASGCTTYKMRYGHRGSNHAVTDGMNTWITSHNHGYAVSESSMEGSCLNVLQRDINDGTVEMVGNGEAGVLAAQYHPEGAPGSHDLSWFFERVKKIVEDSVARG